MTGQTVDEILQSIQTGKPEVLATGLNALIAKGREISPTLTEALKSASVLQRWIAASALGEIGDAQTLPALGEALDDENLSVRIQAAHSLAKLGSTQGIPILIAALTSDQIMIGHPPELASDYANRVLESITSRSFGFSGSTDLATRSATMKRWQAWWEDNRSSFRLMRY
jgi:HEAT repeat protein